MVGFVNVCRYFPTAGGTTDWTYSSAVTGYQSPASAGVVNAATYRYRAESSDLTQWEIGYGVYTTATGVLTRATVLYNSAGTGTGAGQSGAGTKISFNAAPQVAIVALAEDLAATFSQFEYTATAGQTTFSGADLNGATLAYTPPYIEVFLNGVKLNKADFTASNGTSVVLAATALSDQVTMLAFTAASVANALVPSNNLSDLVSPGQARTNLAVPIPVPQGRLTLQSVTPVMTTTQSGKTTIYYTPYLGNQVPIWDGSFFVPTVITELSALTTDTTKSPAAIGASKVNDWFVWNDAGTIRLSHGPDWTNDTTRSAGAALSFTRGMYLNGVGITNGPGGNFGTYVGTTRSNASSQLDWILGASASGGTAAFLGVWNAYNRVSVGTTVTDSGVSYVYATATVRQARASAGNQISFVLGLQEDAVAFSHDVEINTAASLSSFALAGVGFDTTTTISGSRILVLAPTAAVFTAGASISGQWSPGIGLHVLASVEAGDTTNITFDRNSGDTLHAVTRM